MTMSSPVGRAADAIVSAIETQITQGQLPDNSPLPSERDLMATFDTSRTVVREAVTALANRGLIVCEPRHRPRVRLADAHAVLGTSTPLIRQLLSRPGGAQNVYQTRMFVERGLVRQATLSASHDDLKQLRQALSANRDAVGHPEHFFTTDTDFHGVLYAITGNPVFSALHTGLTEWLSPHWSRMPRSVEHDQANYLAHESIFNAILERDADAAEAAMVSHLDTAWRLVSSTISADHT